jgi:hypothetical protein
VNAARAGAVCTKFSSHHLDDAHYTLILLIASVAVIDKMPDDNGIGAITAGVRSQAEPIVLVVDGSPSQLVGRARVGARCVAAERHPSPYTSV